MDINLESSAAKEFERLFRMSEQERRAAAILATQDARRSASLQHAQGSLSDVQARTVALLDAYDKNVADRFLEPSSTFATEELQRWLGENATLDFEFGEDQPPKTVGAFTIIRPISQGDLCSIYLAEQTNPVVRTAAIKVLHSTARRRETLRRFDAERQAIAAMRHPNIAQFYEAGASESGHAYFAMEFIDGPQITSFCVERSFGVHDRLRLFLQVCGAIAHAHQRGILHRDLKPSNILVATEGGAGTPQAKVIDFGVSKALERGGDSRATMTGQVVGTIAYMSPEQLRGDAGSVDTRSDVFALGLVLFEMLTGRPPFVAPTTDAGHLRRADDPPTRLSAANPQFRGDLDMIVAKATAMDPELRYASVTDFAGDLERFLAGRPVLARGPGLTYVASKFVRRHWIATVATVLVLAASAAAGAAVITARSERGDLAMKFAQAWLEDLLDTQRSIGESAKREPRAKNFVDQTRELDSQLPDDPRVRSMLASAVTELGYVNLAKGDAKAAARNFDEALAIRREHASIGFGSLGGLGELSLAMIRRGDAANAEGDRELRTRLYQEAFEIDRQAAARYPDDRMALSNLGWSHERIAVLLEPDDRARFDLHARQLEIFSQLNAKAPSADSQHGLSSGYANVALTKRHLGLPFMDDARLALLHGRAAEAFLPHDRHLILGALKAEIVFAESQPDPQATAAGLLDAIRKVESFCEQDPGDNVSNELLKYVAVRCDELLAAEVLDGATAERVRQAKVRIERLISGPSGTRSR